MTFNEILGGYVQEEGGFDGNPVRDGLLRDLAAHQRQQSLYQNIQIVLIILLTIMAGGALAFDLAVGGQRYMVLAGAGVSIPTLLAVLHRTINEIARTNLFIILVKNSDEKEARALLRKYTARK